MISEVRRVGRDFSFFDTFQTGPHRVTFANLIVPKIVRKEGAESGTHLRLGINWVFPKARFRFGRNHRFS